MPAQPIVIDLAPTDPLVTRMERHGYINLINVVHAELQLVERMVEAPGSLRSAIHLCEAAGRAYRESRVASRHLDDFARFYRLIRSDVEETLQAAGQERIDSDVREAVGILYEVLPEADLRVQEVVARHGLARPGHRYTAAGFASEVQAGLGTGARPEVRMAAADLLLPCGTERAVTLLVRGMSAGDDAGITVEIGATDGDGVRVRVEGAGRLDGLERLAAGQRPSALHDGSARLDESTRGVLMLYYLCTPGGAVTVDQGDGRAVVDARLAAAAAPREID